MVSAAVRQSCCYAGKSTSHTEQRLEEMRALLAECREHLPLWHGYGQQLYKAGHVKVTPNICLAVACELAPPDACVQHCFHLMNPHPLLRAASKVYSTFLALLPGIRPRLT